MRNPSATSAVCVRACVCDSVHASVRARRRHTLWWTSSLTRNPPFPSPSTAHTWTAARTWQPTGVHKREQRAQAHERTRIRQATGAAGHTSPTSTDWLAHTSCSAACQPASSSEHALTGCRRARVGQLSCVAVNGRVAKEDAVTPTVPLLAVAVSNELQNKKAVCWHGAAQA